MYMIQFCFFFILTQGYVFIDFKERVGRGGNSNVRNIGQLPPIRTLPGNWTHNLLVYGMALQPTEPPSQGHNPVF